ncbi:TPA: Arc family DNA-binding protein [Vibrio mimicus]|nr:Arc family DNA-binding protein [Vibrio cholerae]EKA4530334.1 Arc family DNA-binding protein [Vibrio cholerae]EKF9203489.1 Arc family DNA-binding protein [Vibrio cholerae]
MAKERIVPYPLRMAEDLRKPLEAMAKENGRSLHAEIETRLLASLQKDVESGAMTNADPYQKIIWLTAQARQLMDLVDGETLKIAVDTGRVKIKDSK